MLRGGAPFLSPADGALLVRWLDDGVPVPTILAAVESAAEARRKRRSRRPLTLRHAKRHLEKVEPIAPSPTSQTPLRAMADGLLEQAEHDPRRGELEQLARTLAALGGSGPDIVTAAMACITAFFTEAWEALPPRQRQDRLDEALEIV